MWCGVLLYPSAEVPHLRCALCFETGTGTGNDLQQTVRQELLTRRWSVTPQRSTSVLPPSHRSAASPLVTAGLEPMRAKHMPDCPRDSVGLRVDKDSDDLNSNPHRGRRAV